MSDLALRVQRIAASARVSHETERERNRREMPGATAFVDEWRHMIGWARLTENGRTVEFGKRTPDARVNTTPFASVTALAKLIDQYGGEEVVK